MADLVMWASRAGALRAQVGKARAWVEVAWAEAAWVVVVAWALGQVGLVVPEALEMAAAVRVTASGLHRSAPRLC